MKIQYITVTISPWVFTEPENAPMLRIQVKACGMPTEHITEIMHESDTVDRFSYIMDKAKQIIRDRLNAAEGGPP